MNILKLKKQAKFSMYKHKKDNKVYFYVNMKEWLSE